MEILKDIGVLVLLVVLARKKVHFGNIFLVCAVLFGLLHHMTVLQLSKLVWISLTSEATLTICGAIYFIILLEKIMRQAGSLDRLVTGLKNLSRNPRIPMAALTALIGLLPSPGGARFSAPMVEEASRDLEITCDGNAAVNYYFRHIWEYCLPFTGGNLLAIEILQIPVSRFILMMFPLTLVSLLAGLLIFRKTKLKKDTPDIAILPAKQTWKYIAEGLVPVITALLLALILDLPIFLAIMLVDIFLILYYRLNVSSVLLLLKQALEIRLLYLIFGAIYLRETLVQSGSIDQLLGVLNAAGLAPLLVAIIFPLIIAMLTGLSYPGISIALPVVISLAGPDNLLPLSILALTGNAAGLMLSPVHPCLLMTIEHFSARFLGVYLKIILPEIIIIGFALSYVQLF